MRAFESPMAVVEGEDLVVGGAEQGDVAAGAGDHARAQRFDV